MPKQRSDKAADGNKGDRAISAAPGNDEINGSAASADELPAHTVRHLRLLESRIAAIEARYDGVEAPKVRHKFDLKKLQALARQASRERAARRRFFPSELVSGEPCWDILLDLTVAQIDGKRISVTSACLAAEVPSTTALRWITIMENLKLIEREQDEADRRRTFLKLTSACFEAMVGYFEFLLGDKDPDARLVSEGDSPRIAIVSQS